MNNISKKVNITSSKTPNIERILQFAIAVVMYVFTLFLVFPNYVQKIAPPTVSEVVSQPFIVKRTIKYENKSETQKLIDYAKANFTPIFDMPNSVEEDTISKVKEVFSFMRLSYDDNVPINDMYNTFLNRFHVAINQTVFSNATIGELDVEYEKKIIDLLMDFFNIGVLSRSSLSSDTFNLVVNNGIFLYKFDNYLVEEKTLPRNGVYFLEDLQVDMPSIVGAKYRNLDIDQVNTLAAFINGFLKDNLFYNAVKSEERLENIISSIKPVYSTIKKGYPILRVGERVTEEKADLIRYVFANDGSGAYNIFNLLGQSIFILFIFISVGFIIFRYKIPFYTNMKKFILFSIEYVIIMLVVYLAHNYRAYYFMDFRIPFYVYTFIPMFAIINSMLGAKKGISSIVALCITVLASNIVQASLFDTFILFMVSIMSSIAAKRINNRTGVLWLGFVIGVSFLFGSLINIFLNDTLYFNALTFLLSFLSGMVQALLVMIILPICEYLLDTATIFKLQELADLNNPLLRKLQMNAPGTYHHSISMGSLVETIAEEIGENARLACVSAYYHDIGKMENPVYYIENTTRRENRHKKLKPTLSASIVKSHVRIGVEIARKYRLPKEVIDAIKEHHGTSLIKYFYVEALGENPEVDKTLFLYPGPRPQSKITAIIMILDSIEAASRTLEAPKREDLEKLIKNIVNEKIVQGELNDSGLTLKDIDTIQRIAFQKIMVSLHERIKYPELPEQDNSNKKNRA